MDIQKQPEQGATLHPWAKIEEHISSLDKSLLAIQGYTEESALTRQFIIGQIEAAQSIAISNSKNMDDLFIDGAE